MIQIEGGQSHIGAAALAEPYRSDGKNRASVSVFCRKSHREDEIAILYARQACEQTGHPVLAVCGIHYDDFNQQIMQEIQTWIEQDLKKLNRELNSLQSDQSVRS